MKFSGIIKRITYYNQENGYTVVRVEISDDTIKDIITESKFEEVFTNIITVVSNFSTLPFIDQVYEFDGTFEKSKYGIQFRSLKSTKAISQNESGIVAYLSSSIFKGIGEKTATKIYNKLGNNALKLIVENKKNLDGLRLSKKQIDIIYNSLCEYYTEEETLVELLSYGITLKLATRLIKALHKNTLQIVKENPYCLIDKVEGIGFLRADDIAVKVGIDKKSPFRLKALIMNIINQIIYTKGDTFIRINELYVECIKAANGDDEILNKDNFNTFIEELVNDKKIIFNGQDVCDVKIGFQESEIARFICEHLNDKTNLEYSVDKVINTIEEVEKSNNIKYGDKQKEAIKNALLEPIVIITGGPGTGKSTIIKGIVETYTAMFKTDIQDVINSQIILAAPTGRAAKRLREVSFHKASTIHRILGYTGYDFTTDNIDCKMIIIDEFSMVDISLAYHLFKSLRSNVKVVIVGDSDQLPAVGAGDILNDLILSKEITTVKLDKIHRQAQTSTIINLAHNINEGILPEDISVMQHDRKFIKCDDENIISLTIKTLDYYFYSKINNTNDFKEDNDLNKAKTNKYVDNDIERLSKEKDLLINGIQVLVPMYRGNLGIDAFNSKMQEHFNPLTSSNYKQIMSGNKIFRVYDKVIQLINRNEKNVMNGDIGYISSIKGENNQYEGLYVQYTFGEVYYNNDELDDITLAYAISIHKAQGSEFGLVIVPFSFKYYIMLKKKLIYTAITRAKKYLIMIGNFDAMRKGIIQIEEKRKTKLQEKIKGYINNPKAIFDVNSAFSEIKEIEDVNDSINPYDFMD